MKKQIDPAPDAWDRLDQIFDGTTDSDVMYIYRLDPDRQPVKPYLDKVESDGCLNSYAFPSWLRDTHGRGGYRAIIRRGRVMVYSGDVWIG
jgi:hypothetical protein